MWMIEIRTLAFFTRFNSVTLVFRSTDTFSFSTLSLFMTFIPALWWLAYKNYTK